MKFLSLIALCASMALMTGCLEQDASVSELAAVSIVTDDVPVTTSPVVTDEPEAVVIIDDVVEVVAPVIVIDDEDSDEIESDDDVVIDEETEEENIVVDGDDGAVDEPVPTDDPVVIEEEDNVDEEEEEVVENDDEDLIIDDDLIVDEDTDQKCRVKGNLIQNGSFEIVDDRKGLRGKSLDSINSKNWDVFNALPSKNEESDSWYTSSGAGIEVQGDNTVAKTPHGKRVVELDSHGGSDTNSTMSQDVYLCRGRHVIKFHYYPRTNSLNDNNIEVHINDKLIKSVDMVKTGDWFRIRAPFKVKEKGSYKISFSAAGKDNSLGGLVDKIKLHKKKRRAGVVTSLLSLGDQDNISSPLIKKEIAKAVISKAVNFASLKRKPKILMLKDDFHGGESLDDFVFTEAMLKELYSEEMVSVISGEVKIADVTGFDLIYILNPGHPMGSAVTADTLREVKELGTVGIVIMGDDMARGRNFKLTDLTGLEYKSNGTSACGIRIDNNKGKSYSVSLRKRFFKKLEPESRILTYANDIDHTVIVNKAIKVLAKAKAPNECGTDIPTIVGYKLKHHKENNDEDKATD